MPASDGATLTRLPSEEVANVAHDYGALPLLR